ncbi:DUF4097 family beta strand repeat-containing protein [Kitasatospora sp. NPDC092286]|uniref:DUF4097 family beta strand repeat-containing protein n=1 Tax=Kitasatospora sp. NPDC092286 TaxID=3364087 RepID=UPI003814212B
MKKPTAIPAWVAALPALAAALTGCGVTDDLAAQPRSDSQDFAVHGDQFTVETDQDVTLLPADGKAVRVDRHLTGRAAQDGNATWVLDGTTLRLSATCSGVALNCQADHTVHVPRNMAVTVRGTGPAGVTAKGIDGRLDVTTGQGGVDIDTASGPLRVRTRSGHITANGLTSPEVDAANDHGSVKLAFRTTPTAVSAGSTTGSITVSVPKDGTRYRVSAAAGSSRPHVDVDQDPGSPRTITATSKVGVVRVNTKD